MKLGPFVAWTAGAVAALSCAASVARADTPPNVWDVAKDPASAERWALHVRVDGLLRPPVSDDRKARFEQSRDEELHCEAAYAMLEQAGAAQSSDIRLRFDLGAVQYKLAELLARPDLYEKAAETLSAAVAAAPDHPGTPLALERLAYAYAKLDRPSDELRAWRRYIPTIIEPYSRAVSLMNMGEAEMRMGLVDDALATFREVLRACGELPNDSSTYVLALWDLAVALDRSGDARGALETAGKAARETAIDSNGHPVTGRALIENDKAVFFVPEWERQWYLALGSEALSQGSEPFNPKAFFADPVERDVQTSPLEYLVEAEQEWDRYITSAAAAAAAAGSGGAGAATDGVGARAAAEHWLRIARLRHDRVHAERIAVEKRLPKRAPPLAHGAND